MPEKQVWKKRSKWKSVKHEFRHSFDFFTANIANTLYTNTNAFVLGLVATPIFVGYYVAAEKLYNAIHMLGSPFGTAMYPYISKTKNVKMFKKVFFPFMLILFLLVVFIFIFAKEIITIFYGVEMIFAYKILRIFCVTVCISLLSGNIGFPLVAAMGHSRIVNLSITIAAITHITLLGILYFLNCLNIWTIAYLTILPYSIMLILRIYGIIKYKLWNYQQEEQNV